MSLFPYPPTSYDEPRRGQFHFSSQSGWMNDPNGLVHYRGIYHLFYQHNPHSLEWDTMHWGHATSPDLVHWTQQPIALHPDIHPGVLFSGGGIVDRENDSGLATDEHDPILVFTGTEEIRAMVSLDGAETFVPFDEGRVLIRPGGSESRDPKVFRHEPSGQWVMVLWVDEGGYGMTFYGSRDLRSWTRLSRIEGEWMFECPDVSAMPLDGDPGQRCLVLVSASGTYLVGDFDGERFVPLSEEPRTVLRAAATGAGSDYWAAQTFSHDPKGRVVSIGWQGRNRGASWTGNFTFPVEQQLRTVDGVPRVHSTPVEEISSLRASTTASSNLALGADGQVLAADPAAPGADGLDLELVLERAEGVRVLLESVTGSDTVQTLLTYDGTDHTLDGVQLPDASEVRIRVLLDRDQLALFAAGGLHYSAQNRCLEDPQPQAGIRLRTEGGDARATELTVHTLRSAWPRGQDPLQSALDVGEDSGPAEPLDIHGFLADKRR